MAARDSDGRNVSAQSHSTVEHSFDDLARGLASGSISRGKALRLLGGALAGAALASVPGVGWAVKKTSTGTVNQTNSGDQVATNSGSQSSSSTQSQFNPGGDARDVGGGNSACAQFCRETYPPGPERGACISAGARGQGPCFDNGGGGCQSANECPQPTDQCQQATCVEGTCGFATIPNCQGCTTADECPAATGQCQQATCIGGICGVGPRDNGAACTDPDPCVTGETCQQGACVGTLVADCVRCDQNPGACEGITGLGQCQQAVCGSQGFCEVEVREDGTECNSGDLCAPGTCQAGACVGTAVVCPTPGEEEECVAENVCNPNTGDCEPRFVLEGIVCREAAGSCDVAATCTGTSAACPPNEFRPDTVMCREADGDCDVAEFCTGTSAACPEDVFAEAGTPCREAAGDCDVAATCTGESAECPPNEFLGPDVMCRPAAGDCDVAEFCTGTSAACPLNAFRPAGTVCREAVGECEEDAVCTGTSAACPDNPFSEAGTVCREAAGPCDVAEVCTGNSAQCPEDRFAPSTQECRQPQNQCQAVATCPGNGATCPSNPINVGATCNDGNPCTTNDLCQSDGSCRGTQIICGTSGGQAQICCGTGTAAPGQCRRATGTTCSNDNQCCSGSCPGTGSNRTCA